ncbi:hypothetical protein C4N15_06590 [Fusobacterium necrophorum subsp. funduliforme]|uniref:hypothetical protein n=1 Tax=Fusobacterium necrophorum TaxID=859 RepID=UPI000245DD25|nr:hypothetical protein [Fusobacterium necrophorum]AVQ21323.1 hypothetical protein C4N15_06590 [Fusobacterium necrophorum subsp. funduliforme]EHO19827.1 hypothetical protein HMPREF9466_01758 [Fusobacterium necrophorum subsp. funduliforme 1_1_36S]
MEIEMTKEVKEYLERKSADGILLEYMPPCSMCNSSTFHVVAHIVKIRDQNKIKDFVNRVQINGVEILIPKEIEHMKKLKLEFKKALLSKNGSIKVTYYE